MYEPQAPLWSEYPMPRTVAIRSGRAGSSRPRLPAELSTLVDACLKPDPGERPELAEALRRL